MLVSLLEDYFGTVIAPEGPRLSQIPPFKYSPLPTPISVRLLNIHPDPSSTIHCSIQIADLDDSPLYDALSYTWGDPRDPIFQSITPEQYRRRHDIICDGCLISVTENLYHALQRLRSLKRNGISTKDGIVLQNYVWIDALCINQADDAERGSQVAMMDEIYSNSRRVIAWLGRKYQYTDRAVEMIHQLANSQPTRGTALLSRFLSALAWVIQELALAPRILFFWGNQMIQGDELLKCAQLTTAMREKDNDLEFTRSYFASIQDHMNETGLLPLTPGLSYVAVTRNRSSLYSGHKTPWYAIIPIALGRNWISTDPRDRVYATFGIVKSIINSCPRTEPVKLSAKELPIPDYAKSAKEVYTEFAMWLFKVSDTIIPLAMVEDRSKRSPGLIDVLPSWVPDFSVLNLPTPSFLGWANLWQAAKGEEIGIPLLLDGRILIVKAAYFDKVRGVAAPIESTFSKECIYSILGLVEPFAGSQYPLLPMSYIDALWRTLIMDSEISTTGALIHPARPGRRQRFPRMVQRMLLKELIFQVAQDPTIFKCSGRTDEEHALRAGFEEHLKALFSLKKDSPSDWFGSFEDFLHFYVIFLRRESRFAPRDITHIQTAIATLSKRDSPGRAEMLSRIGRFRLATEKAMMHRRLFITATGCIGLAGQSVAVGDEVWIVAGLTTPVVLRRSQSGRFKWMGEAYVHGIMQGEAVRSGRLKFHDIDLE
ncbi:HET domain containing protein [Hyaloscypha variabilis]